TACCCVRKARRRLPACGLRKNADCCAGASASCCSIAPTATSIRCAQPTRRSTARSRSTSRNYDPKRGQQALRELRNQKNSKEKNEPRRTRRTRRKQTREARRRTSCGRLLR